MMHSLYVIRVNSCQRKMPIKYDLNVGENMGIENVKKKKKIQVLITEYIIR